MLIFVDPAHRFVTINFLRAHIFLQQAYTVNVSISTPPSVAAKIIKINESILLYLNLGSKVIVLANQSRSHDFMMVFPFLVD